METLNPKISILIITYKQEELIKRAINSLLTQKDFIYEICVSDDCSPDHTWEVLQEYDRQYPGLFRLNRNEPNLGIFGNYEKALTMLTGDIVYQMAGDDECYEGWFGKVIDFIQTNKIDFRNESFCIYGDYKSIYPNGDVYIARNSAVMQHPNALGLAMRHVICNRSCCFSSKVLKQYKNVSQGRSQVVEEIVERQLQVNSEKNYYIPYVGNIYYANIGVSVHGNDRTHKERQQIPEYTLKKFEEWGVNISSKDANYLLSTSAYFAYKKQRTIKNLLTFLELYVKGIDLSIGLKGIRPKRIIFAIRRRLPHRKPIQMYV